MWFLVLFGQPAGMGSDGFRPQASDQHNVPQLRVPASTPFSVLNNIMEALVKAGSSNCMKWEWNRFTSIKVSVADITVCRRAVRRQNDTRHDTFINKINRGQQQAIKVCKHNSQRFFFLDHQTQDIFGMGSPPVKPMLGSRSDISASKQQNIGRQRAKPYRTKPQTNVHHYIPILWSCHPTMFPIMLSLKNTYESFDSQLFHH